jgi:GT2 family glycosyltransferase
VARRTAAGGDGGVTVVLCTRGRDRLLADCLGAMAGALSPGDELLLLEDVGAATAGPGPAALAELPSSWRHYRVRARWKTWVLNRALLAANTDLVLVTDDDCQVPQGWPAAMTAPFDDPRVAVAFGPVAGLAARRGGQARFEPPAGEPPAEPWAFAHGASMAVRREAVLAVGGFDERLGAGRPPGGGEEADLLVRLQAAGWRAAIAGGPPVIHAGWRDEADTAETLLRYERGAGTWIGACLRRDRVRGGHLLRLRLYYQLELLRQRRGRQRLAAARALAAFGRGLLAGLGYRPRGWV